MAKEGKSLAQELGMKCKNLSRLKIAQSGCKNRQPEIKLPYENLERKTSFLANWVINSYIDESNENMDPNAVEELPARPVCDKMKQEAEKNFLHSLAYQRKSLNNLEHPPTFEDIQDCGE